MASNMFAVNLLNYQLLVNNVQGRHTVYLNPKKNRIKANLVRLASEDVEIIRKRVLNFGSILQLSQTNIASQMSMSGGRLSQILNGKYKHFSIKDHVALFGWCSVQQKSLAVSLQSIDVTQLQEVCGITPDMLKHYIAGHYDDHTLLDFEVSVCRSLSKRKVKVSEV